MDQDRARQSKQQCVADSICHRSPWGQITGQIFLGSTAFRERRASLLPDQRAANVPRIQTDSTLLKGDEIMISVAAVYGISTTAMVACTHREAYQAAIWLLQSATNEPLNTVMGGLVCTITHARSSKIQDAIESTPLILQQRQAIAQCKVKQ